jgi:hypothetical protein
MTRSTDKIEPGVKSTGNGQQPAAGPEELAYQLEFLTGTEKHPVNSQETIQVPYIELGRDKECTITFGNDVPMVSRKHAAIERRGREVFLKQLSQTNQTLLNGRPVTHEWYLTNGDEIQLSPNGPRMRYLETPVKPATVGISQRIQLFAKQSLRPYRRALIILLALFVIGALLAAFFFYNLQTENKKLKEAYVLIDQQTKQQQDAIQRGDSLYLATQKQLAEKIAASNQEKNQLKESIAGLEKKLDGLKKTPPPPLPKKVPAVTIKEENGASKVPLPAAAPLTQQIEEVRKHVYFLKMYLTVEGEMDHVYVGSGTGFLLDDGRFITARHCIQPWVYADIEMSNQSDEMWLIVNWLYYNSPKGKVKLEVELTSPENKVIQLNGDKFTISESKDLFYNKIDVGYGPGKIQLSQVESGTDWAYYAISEPKKVGIQADPELAASLKSGTVLHLLGYTFGLGNSEEAPSPFYSTANVSQNGLVNGLINVSNLGISKGNSGGPVFVEKEGQLINVGIVSASNAVLGMIVPISAIK